MQLWQQKISTVVNGSMKCFTSTFQTFHYAACSIIIEDMTMIMYKGEYSYYTKNSS